MKYTILLPLVATAATSFIIPDAVLSEQIALAEGTIQDKPADQADESFWWSDLSSKEDVIHSIEETVKGTIDSALEAAEAVDDRIEETFESFFNALVDEEDDDEGSDGGHHGGHHGGKHGHHRHGNASKTIYELVTESNHTTKFAKVLEDYPEIADLLKDTEKNHTLFVPTDKAFERIPDHHKDKDKKPSKEFILAALQYHAVPGLWPAGRLLFHHTVPTELSAASLGDRPQRLRVRGGLFGLRVNFFSKVVAANVVAKNGVIHAVDHILVPPPPIGRILTALPTQFSTLTLAFETTGLGEELAKLRHTGGTLFAPTNHAWAKLGPKINAFLFSKPGKKYLSALLKYHAVANETLYSDAYYGEGKGTVVEGGDDGADGQIAGHWHIDLPSLLGDKTIGVDVRRFGRFISVHVNGWVRVIVQDGVSRDGVIQVVGSVLIPPHKRKGKESISEDYEDDKISVDELIERLGPYVDEPEKVWGDL